MKIRCVGSGVSSVASVTSKHGLNRSRRGSGRSMSKFAIFVASSRADRTVGTLTQSSSAWRASKALSSRNYFGASVTRRAVVRAMRAPASDLRNVAFEGTSFPHGRLGLRRPTAHGPMRRDSRARMSRPDSTASTRASTAWRRASIEILRSTSGSSVTSPTSRCGSTASRMPAAKPSRRAHSTTV